MFDAIMKFFNSVDDVMYYPILIIVLAAAGLFFTFRTRFVQLRLFGTACKLIVEKPAGEQKVSSFQALMVSTASRVGTGNIVGVSTAICIGGPGACFWMWLMCVIGALGVYREYARADLQAQGQGRQQLRRSCLLHREGREKGMAVDGVLRVPDRDLRVRLQSALLL